MHKVSHFLAALLVAAMAVTSCSDKGTGPKPPQDKDYVVYFTGSTHTPTFHGSIYYAYHTLTGRVDSLVMACPDCCKNGCAVSPDGSILYIYDGSAIITVDAATLQVTGQHPAPYNGPRPSPIRISPDGKFLVIEGYELSIISLPDYDIAFSDSVSAFNGYFSRDGRYYYCGAIIGQTMPSYRVDLENDFAVSKWYLPYGGAYMTVPSNDGKKLFLYDMVGGPLFYFLVYDIAKDSLIFIKELIPGFGQMALTPDGRYLIVTQMDPMNMYMPAPDYFTIFDVDGNQVYKEVCTWCTTEDSIEVHTYLGHICITPDGEHLINTEYEGDGFFDFNLKKMKYNRFLRFGGRFIAFATCQSQP